MRKGKRTFADVHKQALKNFSDSQEEKESLLGSILRETIAFVMFCFAAGFVAALVMI